MKSSLTLTTSRLVHHARLYCGELFVFLAVEFFDILRLEDSHMNAAGALLARVAPPPVLAEAAASAVLALAALAPVRTGHEPSQPRGGGLMTRETAVYSISFFAHRA